MIKTNKKNVSRETKEVKEREFIVDSVHCFDDDNILISIKINKITFYNLKVITYKDKKTHKEKQFIAEPQRKGKDEKYYKYYYLGLTDNETESILKQVQDYLDTEDLPFNDEED